MQMTLLLYGGGLLNLEAEFGRIFFRMQDQTFGAITVFSYDSVDLEFKMMENLG